MSNEFRTTLGHNIFHQKYAISADDTWDNLCVRLVEDVCGGNDPLLPKSELADMRDSLQKKEFIPGGPVS